MKTELGQDYLGGVSAVQKACIAPALKLCLNAAGEESSLPHLISKQKSSSIGVDFRSLAMTDLLAAGIIDPVWVVKNSLLYGTSVASILLSAECAVVAKEGSVIREH